MKIRIFQCKASLKYFIHLFLQAQPSSTRQPAKCPKKDAPEQLMLPRENSKTYGWKHVPQSHVAGLELVFGIVCGWLTSVGNFFCMEFLILTIFLKKPTQFCSKKNWMKKFSAFLWTSGHFCFELSLSKQQKKVKNVGFFHFLDVFDHCFWCGLSVPEGEF